MHHLGGRRHETGIVGRLLSRRSRLIKGCNTREDKEEEEEEEEAGGGEGGGGGGGRQRRRWHGA
jgi:hypothetical protein